MTYKLIKKNSKNNMVIYCQNQQNLNTPYNFLLVMKLLENLMALAGYTFYRSFSSYKYFFFYFRY